MSQTAWAMSPTLGLMTWREHLSSNATLKRRTANRGATLLWLSNRYFR